MASSLTFQHSDILFLTFSFRTFPRFNISSAGFSGNVTIKDMEKEETFIVNVTVPEISHSQNLKQLKVNDGQVMPMELQALDIIMRNGPRLCKLLNALQIGF